MFSSIGYIIFAKASSYSIRSSPRHITGSIVAHSISDGFVLLMSFCIKEYQFASAYFFSRGAIIWQRLQNSPDISLIVIVSEFTYKSAIVYKVFIKVPSRIKFRFFSFIISIHRPNISHNTSSHLAFRPLTIICCHLCSGGKL